MEVAETGAGQDVVKTSSSSSESSTEVSVAQFFHKLRIKRDHLYSNNIFKEKWFWYAFSMKNSNEYFYFD